MGLMASDKGKDFELISPDTYIARCYRVIDLGTQHNEQFNKDQRKVMLAWECPTALMEDGRPFSISKRYTVSLNEKAALRHDLESWRGRPFSEEELKGFDLKKILGVPCMICVVHETRNGKTYANVRSVMALPKGMSALAAVNQPQFFDVDEWDDAVYKSLSAGLQAVIANSREVKGGTGEEASTDEAPPHGDEDVPF